MKVLHIIESLDRGATENWLLRMLGHARVRGLAADWTFYCTLNSAGELEQVAQDLGARVIASPVALHNKVGFMRALRAELQRGRYDVLHCQHDLVSGLYLAASIGLPIRRRIVHVHNPDESVLTPSRLKQAILKPALRHMCFAMADRIAANSSWSLSTFLAGRAPKAGRDSVHYLGIDPSPFVDLKPDRNQMRCELGIAQDAPILLFAGRMTPEKNPLFVIDVLAALRQRVPEVCGVFAGVGSLEGPVRERAEKLGQQNAVRILGWRNDIPLLMAASDWFILPHPEDPPEGFGVAVVEAQLAGLRLLMSLGVSDDPLLPVASVRRLSLLDDAQIWAQAAIDLLNEPAPSREAAIAALRASPMDMDRALASLQALYR